jgi:hypothetical protein
MRLRQLRSALHDFCEEAAWQLASDAGDGHEVSFEVVAGGRRDSPLYCYRPLTGDFIRERSGALALLASHLPAAHALIAAGRIDSYLDAQGVRGLPPGRERAEAALHCFLARVFEDSTDFVFQEHRFDAAFRELEGVVGEGRTENVCVAALVGIALQSDEVPLGDGLSLARGDAFAEAPDEVRWDALDGHPNTLVVVRWEPLAGDPAPVGEIRGRLARMLTGLRLYDNARVALAPLAWTRTAGGPWQPLAIGPAPGPESLVQVSAEQEDELRAFVSLIARRTPRAGEIAWALRRFEASFACADAADALTEVLLALRALLEPEGPKSGRLPGRLAALCAVESDRARLAERVAHAVSLERALIAGLSTDGRLEGVTEELTGHLRALLRDVLCGHLEPDLRALADSILAQDSAAREQQTVA